jgi:hypothetical protein
MIRDEEVSTNITQFQTTANDKDGAKREPVILLNKVAFELARILGRQLAREHYADMIAANDNKCSGPRPNRRT